jgi:trimeric autotransporter adhesin
MKRIYLSIILCCIAFLGNAQITNSESFDGGTFVPSGWTNLLTSGTNTWTRVTTGTLPTTGTHSGAGMAKFNSYNVNGGVRSLVTPAYSLADRGSATPTVSFWMYRDNGYNTTADKIQVYINTSPTWSGGTLVGTVNRARGLSPTVGSNGWYQYTFNVPVAYNTATNYLILKATSAYGNNIYVDDVSWQSYPSLAPCAGMPDPGTVSTSASVSCSAYSPTLTLVGNTVGPGISYQWQSSPNNTAWTDVSGATNSTYIASVSTSIYYRCNVTCAGSGMSAATPGVLLSISSCHSMVFNTTQSATMCTGLVYDDGGPTGNYTPTTGNSVITIYPGATGTGSKVTVHFNFIDVETCCDYVRVYNGNSTAAPQVGGNYTSAPADITSTAADGSLTIYLHSDISISYSGFEAVITNTIVNPITSQPTAFTNSCIGYSPSISVGVNGSSNTFEWFDNGSTNSNVGGTSTGITTASFNPSTAAAGTHYYYCVVTTACGNSFTTNTAGVTVYPSPAAITGGLSACSSATSALTSVTIGGIWSTSSAIASVDAGGVVTAGAIAGTTTVSYTVAGCASTATFVVNASPGVTTGTQFVCEGSTTTLSNPGGVGTWTSSSTGVATVDVSTGVVSGLTAGTAAISYANGCGAPVAAVVTVNAMPGAIAGPTIACAGNTVTLSNSVSGGTWSSGNTAVATIASGSGLLSGVSMGTATITYNPGNGCANTTRVQTVNLTPIAPTVSPASTTVCSGQVTTLTATTPVSGSNTTSTGPISIAVPDSPDPNGSSSTLSVSLPAGAVVTGVSVNFNYTHTWVQDNQINLTAPNGNTLNLFSGTGGGADNFVNTTVSSTGSTAFSSSAAPYTGTYAPVGAIGTGSALHTSNVGSFSSLYSVPNGNWIFSIRDVAGGDVGVINSWSITITYTLPPVVFEWTPATDLYTDAGLTTPYTGTNLTTVYANTNAVGTVVYTATGTSNGCASAATATLTTNPLPATITGVLQVCQGLTTTLANADAGGTWNSGNTAIATVDLNTGVATGVSAGTVQVSYTFTGTGCSRVAILTVNALPATIGGSGQVCEAGTATLTDADAGGTWISNNTATATIGLSSGILSGVSSGTSLITYTLPTTCIATKVISVNPLPILTVSPLTPTTLCLGDGTAAYSANATMPDFLLLNQDFNTSLAGWTVDPVIGSPVGQWQIVPSGFDGTSGDGSAMLQASPFLEGSPVHTRIVSPSFSTVGFGSAVLTFNQYFLSDADPLLAVEYSVNGGAWQTLVDYTGTPIIGDGTWSAASPEETLSLPAGAINQADVRIRWNYYGAFYAWFLDNVKVSASLPPATYTWTGGSDLSCTTCTNPTITPSASGANVYTVSAVSSASCISNGTVTINVNPLPSVFGGTLAVCQGLTTTLTNADAGGTWTSGTTSVATIDASSGMVSGVLPGTAMITYTLPTGCSRTAEFTVNALPADITGTMDVCEGLTTTLSEATSGGTWTSGNTAAATVDASGVVSGIAAGNSTITFTITSTGCIKTADVVVNPLPAIIAGTQSVCEGLTTTLTNTSTGGTWLSNNMPVATIGSATGVVSGVMAGNAAITYTLPTGCIRTAEATVNALPADITGTMDVCEGLTTTLNDATTGGTWTSGNTTAATIDASGIVSGIAAGSSSITYTITATGCIKTTDVVVNPLPAAIAGTLDVCEGLTTTLGNTSVGGTWESSNTATATIGSASGILSGVSAGNVMVTYTLPTGCIRTAEATVNALPAAITGAMPVCVGLTIILDDVTATGSWSSSDNTMATVDGVGVVTGVAAGNPMITYTLPTGCIAVAEMTVNPLPAVISGTMQVCEGLTTTLTNATTGGNWISGSTSTATIGASSGTVTGIAAGVTAITYALPTSCIRTADVTVNALPAAIGGLSEVCIAANITLTDADAGGSWSTGDMAIADIDAGTGMVSGMAAGTAPITYTLPTGCIATTEISVNALPVVYNVTGGGSYCFSGTGVNIGTDNSDLTNTYKLYLGSSLMGTQAGTGSTVDFGSQTSAGVYTVVATTDKGCNNDMSGSATVVIIPLITPAVTIGTTPGDTVCAGTMTTFTAMPVNGGTVPAYTWQVNGSPVSSTEDTSQYTPVDGDVITVMMTSNEACPSPATVSASLTMVVVSNETPVATVGAHLGTKLLVAGDTVCQGSTVIYDASAVYGGDSPVFTWYKNGITTAATGAVYAIVPVFGDVISVRLNSNYRCPIVNDVPSNNMALRVDSIYVPIVTISADPGNEIAPGQSVSFKAVVTQGGGAPRYQWFTNSTPVVGATTDAFVSATLADNDSVTCFVWGTGECSYFTFNAVKMKVTTGFVQPTANGSDIRLMPNPNTGEFVVNGTFSNAGSSEVSLEVSDMLGQIVYRNTVKTNGGKLDERVKLNNTLANGMYMLNVRSGSESKVFHFVLKN